MGQVDPTEALLESLVAADKRIELYRKEIFKCTYPEFVKLMQSGVQALAGTDQKAVLRKIDGLDVTAIPGLKECLEEIYHKSLGAGEREAKTVMGTMDLPTQPQIEKKLDQFQDLSMAELGRIDELVNEWFGLIREQMVGQTKELFKGIAETNVPDPDLTELVLGFGEITVSPGAATKAIAPEKVVTLSGRTLTEVSKSEALAWIDQEIRKRAQVVERTGRGAADTIDQEASKTGKTKVYDEDNRITAVRLVAILDDRTTPLCRGLHNTVIDTKDPDWKSGRYIPPFHFNCRTEPVPLGLTDRDKVNIDEMRTVRVQEEGGITTYRISSREIKPGNGITPPKSTLEGHRQTGRKPPGGFKPRDQKKKLQDAEE